MTSFCKIKGFFWLSFTCHAIMASTFLWMPFLQGNRTGTVATGLIFWIAWISGCFFIVLANRERKKWFREKQKKETSMGRRMGIFEFFSNLPAVISDTALAASAVAILVVFAKWRDTYLTYLVLFLMLFSLSAHCLFNGRIYKFMRINQLGGDENHDLCKHKSV